MRARHVIAVLSLVGAFVALYLTLYKMGAIGRLVCSQGSCETVNTSRYAIFLGGPVAAWGLATYVILFIAAVVGTRPEQERSPAISWMLVALSGWSTAFSGWLTYLELYVIRAICIWCLTSAVIMTLIFLASLADLRTVRSGPEPQT